VAVRNAKGDRGPENDTAFNRKTKMSIQAGLIYPSLAQHLAPSQSFVRHITLSVGFSLFMALSAQIAIPLPFTPVPVTGQTLAVLLTGAVLGPRLGFAAVLLYLAEGAMGLPVFSGGRGGAAMFFGPTGGYLMAFPLAAWLTGLLSTRGWDRSALRTMAGMALGNAVIYALGLLWLGVWLGNADKFKGLPALLNAGLLPFLPGDAVKIALAMVLLPSAWKLSGRKS